MRLGIDLGGTSIRMGLVDDMGIVETIQEPSKTESPINEIISHIKEMIGKMIRDDVTGIGVGAPSAVDIERGIVYKMNNIPAWTEVAVKDILESKFKIPVSVNNDANCFALGEKFYGHGQSLHSFLGVCLGTGVGSGVIINDQLYPGSNTFAGEVGCFPYKDGLLEHYCGSHFFSKQHGTTGYEAYENALQGNAEAIQIWNEYGYHIGQMVSLILLAYDPQAVIFGGSISKAYSLFSLSMHKVLDDFLIPKVKDNLQIYVSEINDVAILGAASLVQEK